MVYDILFVPRSEGKYTVPAVEFTYFDVQTDSYKTIRTKPFALTVDKGDGKNVSTSYESPKDNDIRGLKLGATKLHNIEQGFFFGSLAYWICLLLPLLTFIILLVLFRKRALDNADIIKMRGKKADKIARKRLKKAHQLMSQGKSDAFYDEVLRALWDYAGYRLNMPVEQLSRDNITESFASRQVAETHIDRFITALDECEYERYAPGDEAGNMEKTYSVAMTAITEIEGEMKKKH